MKGVILAAGRGTRLFANNGTSHKVLLEVGGQPIIDYALESYRSVGVTDLAIVVGHRREKIRDWVGSGSRYGLKIHYIFNRRYLWGNALSLYAVKSFTGYDPFLLSMADHIFTPRLLERVADMDSSLNVLAVDFQPSVGDIMEGTRVMVDEKGHILRIGKELGRWDGIDAGVFRLSPTVFYGIEDILRQKSAEYQISQAITRMIERGHSITACDITGCFWQDIDTQEDLRQARRSLEDMSPWQLSRKV